MLPQLAVLSATHVVLVAMVVLLLFGAQKIPPLMHSVGSGLSEFKRGLREGERAFLPEAPAPLPPLSSDPRHPPGENPEPQPAISPTETPLTSG